MSGIYLNDLGINNALGGDITSVTSKLFAANASSLEPYDKLFSERKNWVGRVHVELPEIPERLKHHDCRNNQLLLQAYQQIEKTVQTFINKFGKKRIAVILGTSTSGISEGESEFKKLRANQIDFIKYRRQEIGHCSLFLANCIGIEGPTYTISTACSSSKKAFASARRLLKADFCDAVIVGGSDSLCELTLNGFDCLDSISMQICNPFSRNRSGINIGEGAALFVMSKEVSDIQVLGIGESSDAYHISSPDPEGKGAMQAMQSALLDAQLEAKDIGYINLHGTATPKNDEMEAKAVATVFGSSIPASSTKPLIGHTLGAAGAQELAFCYMTLSKKLNPERKLPKHHWDGERDEQLMPIKLCSENDLLQKNKTLSNSFAFGGNNASVILGSSN